jgi:hypothetical protein
VRMSLAKVLFILLLFCPKYFDPTKICLLFHQNKI